MNLIKSQNTGTGVLIILIFIILDLPFWLQLYILSLTVIHIWIKRIFLKLHKIRFKVINLHMLNRLPLYSHDSAHSY